MSHPIEHAVAAYIVRRKMSDVAWTLAPDIGNVFLPFASERLPEDDIRVLFSRIMHSPLTVIALLFITKGRAWPYALHWLMDSTTHSRKQWSWPL